MKALLKYLVNVCARIVVLPLYIVYRSICLLSPNQEAVFWSFSQSLSLIPGKSGSYIRKHFYALTLSSCSTNCAIMFGTILSQPDTEIGSGVYIGPQCNIGMCCIGHDCIIGSGVHIISGSKQHNFTDVNSPIRDQGGAFEKINIGADTWIGNGAIVMSDIGRKCVVGAGAVVTKTVEDYSIVAGNPAKLIRKRIA